MNAPEPGNERDDYDDEDDVEVGAHGNRVVGARTRAVVEHVVKSIAEEPDLVDIDVTERGDDKVLMLIHASPNDMGRLIGRRGRVIQSIRQVARAAASTEGVKVEVDTAD